MSWFGPLERRIARWRTPDADLSPLARVARSGRFEAADIGWISESYFSEGTGPDSPWERSLRDAHMALPIWFRKDLDPWCAEYAQQQQRLWRLIAGIEDSYVPRVHEKEHDWSHVDPVRTPGFFSRRDAKAVHGAADHILATGMLLKHSGLRPGDWALEYGAGFAHTGLALARLGVNVDTVDISPTFCSFVHQQGRFFGVPLNAFQGEFGFHPRPSRRYDLVWFYESFHHCLDFQHVVPRLRDLLAEGGRVILGGEPIVAKCNAAVPYPWGIRLHSEVAAVMRRQGWFELGFSEAFLYELFARSGFRGRRIDCEPSLFGQLHVFELENSECRA